MTGIFKRLLSQWFRNNHKKKKKDDKDKDSGDFIERDTLIKLSLKGERQAIVRNYRVLGIFSKHYNMRFLAFEQKQVVFNPQSMTWKTDSKKYKLPAKMMMLTDQPDYNEVEIKTDGEWSPRANFRVVSLTDVLSDETKLESSNDIW